MNRTMASRSGRAALTSDRRVTMAESRVRAFRRTVRRIERLLAFDLKDTCFSCGVTLAQCHTLLDLEGAGRATVGDLADRMELDKSTLSRTVDGLVRLGKIRRVPHPDDRRAVTLTLTAEGRKTCARIHAVNDRLFEEVLAALPAGKADGIVAALEEFARALAVGTHRADSACATTSEPRAIAPGQRAARRRRPHPMHRARRNR